MAKEKVLLVDDEVEFTEILSERMKTRGVDVDTAVNGPEALTKAREGAYDAVILDLSMPEMDGIETLRRLLHENPELQIILLTGKATLEKGVEAMKMGAVDFLEKPADIKKLMDKIKKAQAHRMVIVEKNMEDKIKDILGGKSW